MHSVQQLESKKLLIFHPYLAPYRIDFFNSLNDHFTLKVYFQYKNDPAQNFHVGILTERAKFSFSYILKGFKIFNRQIRCGISKIIKAERPNAIITHEFAFFSFSVLIYNLIHFRKIKHYITTDDSVSILHHLPWYRKIAKFILLNRIDGLITISSASKDWHLSKYPSLDDRIFDLPIIQNEIIFRERLKEALPISELYKNKYSLSKKKILLFVGRLVKTKGIDILVEEFIKIREEDSVLIIVGEGELKETLQTKISKANDKRIIIAGRFDGIELLAWYNTASVFILPSLFEPFGAVVNEALISGLFTLCSKNSGSSTLIKKNVNGEIFDPLNKEEFQTLLSNILKNIKPMREEITLKENLMEVNFNEKMKEFTHYLNR